MDNKTTLEIVAPSVEEAIEQGLKQLGLTLGDVDVEILDEGNRGLFGLGNRQSHVRLIIKTDEEENKDSITKIEENSGNIDLKNKGFNKPELKQDDIEDEEDLITAKNVILDLLNHMQVNADVDVSYSHPIDEMDKSVISIDITGNDLSILIGRRSETLNSLQYITSIILGRKLGKWVPILIDVQGYRSRREQQLKQMAQRIADQAVLTDRRQVLEPMPPNERRIVHLALRDHPKIKTESVGVEPYRKVTILLKE